MLEKIEAIREQIRPLARRDIARIKHLTGLKHVRYEDILYLKRGIKETLLASDQDNI